MAAREYVLIVAISLIIKHGVHSIPDCGAAVGFKVSQRALQIRVSHPLLHRTQVNAIPLAS